MATWRRDLMPPGSRPVEQNERMWRALFGGIAGQVVAALPPD
jgi:hypothetical protein